jgi:flavodoxin
MNTLILYDSTYGNTAELARVLAGRLGDYGTVRLFRIHELSSLPRVQDVDVLIIGGPTHRHGLSSTLRAFLHRLRPGTLKNTWMTTFDTRYHTPAWQSGSAAPQIARRLKRGSASLLIPPKSFFVTEKAGPLEEGEVREAVHWAEGIYEAFEAQKKNGKTVSKIFTTDVVR